MVPEARAFCPGAPMGCRPIGADWSSTDVTYCWRSGAVGRARGKLHVGQVQRTVKVGNKLVILGMISRKTDAGTTSENTALVYDLSNPAAPQRVAQVVLPSSSTTMRAPCVRSIA